MIESMTGKTPRAKDADLTDENRAESARLKELFNSKNHGMSQAAFGAAYGIGNQGTVWQCLNGRGMAISLQAARGFATGLGVDIAEFSPRLAAEAAKNAQFVSAREGSPPYGPFASGQGYAQLLRDLEDLPPSRRSRLLDQIHQAAEEAREAAEHLRSRPKVAAARKVPAPRARAEMSYGDGNSRQSSLPLSTVPDPFTAEPDEREEELYRNFEKARK